MKLFENEKPKGKITFGDLTIMVEFKKGDTRGGVNKSTGEKWSQTFSSHYGYIAGAGAPDGDSLDAFVKPKARINKPVFVFHNLIPTGQKFDEDKVYLGFDNLDQAKVFWNLHVHEPEKMWGGVSEFTLPEFTKIVNRMKESSQGIVATPENFYSLKNKGFLDENITSLAFNEYLHNE